VEIVERGYNEPEDLWWDMRDWTKKQATQKMLILMDFGLMLKHHQHQSLSVVS